MTDKHDTYRQPAPVCPHCGHEFSTDDMMGHDEDLFALAPDERSAEVTCPDVLCGKTFYVQGGYVPHYTSAIDEDDL